MKPLVSVIVPIYNVEECLEECISSILKQTYKTLEIILIDDGSTDQSGELCEEFSGKDERIIVIHKENGGLSDARNKGISRAGGKYIYFVDSDDILSEDAIEIMVSLCEKNHAEIALTGLKHFKGRFHNKRSKKGGTEILSGKEAVIRMLKRDGFCHEAWGKLYLKKFWGQRMFPEGMLYEDYATIYDVVIKAAKVVYYKEPKYYYRVRENSITRQPVSEKDFVLLDISDNVTKKIISWNPVFEKYAVSMQTATYLKMMKRILDTGFYQYPEVQRRIMVFIKNNGRYMLKSSEVNSLDKIKLITLLLNKGLFYFVYRLGDIKNAIRIYWGIS